MGFWDDWHSKLTGEKSQSERRSEAHQRRERSQHAQHKENELNSQGDRQSQAAGEGYDPASINQHDQWSNWDHKKMKAMVDSIDTGQINQKGTDWHNVGSKLATSFQTFHTEVTGAVKGGWTGNAATAAATAPDGMAKWGTSMAAATKGTGTRIQQASVAADQARINMPEPKDFSWRRALVNGAGGTLTGGLTGGLLSGGNDAYEQHKEQQQAKQQAVNVMNRMYTSGYVDVDNTTPAFSSPVDGGKTPPEHTWPPENRPVRPPEQRPTQVGGDGNGTTDPNGTGGTHDPRQGGVPVGADTGGIGSTDPSGNRTGPTGTTDPSQFDPSNGGNGGQRGGGFDPSRAPANAGNMGMGGMPMMGGGGGFGGTGDSEYGGRGYGSRSSGSGSSATGGGRSGAGIGGSAAQEAAMGGRGAGGRGGMGGMGGGRGGRKEEDSEHETPDYLVETDDVFGSGEMVAPPVIGE